VTQQQTTLQQYTDEYEAQLRADHPHLAAYLDMTIIVRPLWQYGYDVLGEIYATAEAANEAQRAAVMHHLIEVEQRSRL